VKFSVTSLLKSGGSYSDVQTATFTGPNGVPIKGAQVTYLSGCGCHGGYFQGTTNANGQSVFTNPFPGAGSYIDWASITYQGQTYVSQKITIVVP